MPIDPSIPLGVKPPQIESPMNAMLQFSQLQGAQQQNALMGLKTQEAQRAIDDQAALRAGLAAPGADPGKLLLGQGRIKEYQEYQRTQAETQKAQADLLDTKLKQSRAFLDNVTTPEQYIAWHQANHADPVLGPALAAHGVTPEQTMATIQQALQTPGGFQDLLKKSALGLEKFTEANKPTTTVVQAGGSSQVFQTPGLGGTPVQVASVPHTVSPDAQLTDTRTRQLHAETLKKDYEVAGLNPDGTPTGVNDSMIDAIGQYKIAPPTGTALRNPRMQQILAEVAQKYPNFDATQYAARQQAAKAFSTGKDAQAVQSANTALNHLGTLRELAAAQNNGDVRLFNQIANRFATETGSGTAPTNLAAAITMVGPEISKAVIGAGGGQGDREKVDAALAALTKGGKAQAAGVLATMEDLFGGRLTETQRTYERTTGRKDFAETFLSPAAQRVLAARTQATAPQAGGVPLLNAQGWTLHTDAHGNRAYVSPDGKQFQPVTVH
jgi:hypothetical protein